MRRTKGAGSMRKPLVAGVGQQRTLSDDGDDVMAAGADGAHEREQEMAQRKVDVDDLDNFHVRFIGRASAYL